MDTTQAITVPVGDLGGDPIVTIDADALDQIRECIQKARMIKVSDHATFARADAVNQTMRKLLGEMERNRVAIKKPVLDLGRKIDAAHKEGVRGLKEASEELSRQLLAFEREETRKLQEAERAQREKERLAIEAEEKAKREAVQGDPQEAVAQLKKAQQLRTSVVPKDPPKESKVSSVVTRKIVKVEIEDREKIPEWVEHEGRRYYLLVVDEPAVRRALIAGAIVPGAKLTTTTSIASRSR